MNQKTTAEQVVEGDMTIGNFTLQAQMPLGKSITMSGYIYSKSTPEAINKQIDMMHDVLDRQRLRAEIPELEIKLDQRVVQLGQIRDHMVMLGNKKEAGKSLTSQEKKMLDELAVNTERLKEDIVKGQKAIDDAKAKVNGG